MIMKKRWVVVTNGNSALDIHRTWTLIGALSVWDRLQFIEDAKPEPRTWIVGRLVSDNPDGGITLEKVHTP